MCIVNINPYLYSSSIGIFIFCCIVNYSNTINMFRNVLVSSKGQKNSCFIYFIHLLNWSIFRNPEVEISVFIILLKLPPWFNITLKITNGVYFSLFLIFSQRKLIMSESSSRRINEIVFRFAKRRLFPEIKKLLPSVNFLNFH